MVETKTIMILGAGRGQVGTIKAAKSLGLRTLVASLPSDSAPGIPLADEVIHVDISDPESVVKAAREHAVDAVATSCADTGLPALGAVCDALGLVGLSARAADLCNDKFLMKNAFEENGVNTAKYRSIATENELREAIAELGFPLIIKATDLQGSQGISIVRTEDEAIEGFTHAVSVTKRDRVIIEQFIEGDEFGAQGLIQNGRMQYVLPHGDEVFMSRTAVPVGHYVPLDRHEHILLEAKLQVERAARSLGIDNAALNVDLIIKDDEVFVIEITGRAGANGLPEMVSGYYGINYYEYIVKLALGEIVSGPWSSESATVTPTAVRMLIAPDKRGVISDISVDSSIVPDADYVLFRKAGDKLNGFSDSSDCVGQVAVSAETLTDALSKLDLAESALSIQLEA